MILLPVDRKSLNPLHLQIVCQLQNLMTSGTLPAGTPLPSTRTLAASLGVSRSTVIQAYEELWALGYLESRPGSYSIVRKRRPLTLATGETGPSIIDWKTSSTNQANTALDVHRAIWAFHRKSPMSDPVIMSGLSPDVRLFPVHDFKRCLDEVMLKQISEVYRYGESQGNLSLREFIANRLKIHGIISSPEEILITNGSQQSLELVLKLLGAPGAEAVVEDPTYFLLLPLLRLHKVKLLGVPVGRNGMDIFALQDVLKHRKPSMLFTTPNFQNPTGITMDHPGREKLLALCEKYRLPLIEDAFEEEMKYFGKVPLPIKSMDRGGVVIYLGSFSKVFFPGIRLGWIAAPRECVSRLLALKNFSDISSNTVMQLALAEFCRRGLYELYIRKIHKVYRRRMQITLQALKIHIRFSEVSWVEPEGGFLVWLQIRNTGLDDHKLAALFVAQGVRLLPGRDCFVNPPRHNHMRLSISSLNESEIEIGIRRIAEVLERIYSRKKRR